jgi:hypothetical protein
MFARSASSSWQCAPRLARGIPRLLSPAGWWRQDHPKARSFAAAQLMNLGGIPARLLSLGTIDFGIIVNGAILITEAILSQSEARFGESFTEDILGPRDKRK